jgi:hypothetical protein
VGNIDFTSKLFTNSPAYLSPSISDEVESLMISIDTWSWGSSSQYLTVWNIIKNNIFLENQFEKCITFFHFVGKIDRFIAGNIFFEYYKMVYL